MRPNLYWKCECDEFHHISVASCPKCNGIGVPSPKIPSPRPASPDEPVQPNGNLPSKPPVRSYTRNTRNTAPSVATKVEIDTEEPVIKRLRQEIKDEKLEKQKNSEDLNDFEKVKNFVETHFIEIVVGISVFLVTFGTTELIERLFVLILNRIGFDDFGLVQDSYADKLKQSFFKGKEPTWFQDLKDIGNY